MSDPSFLVTSPTRSDPSLRRREGVATTCCSPRRTSTPRSTGRPPARYRDARGRDARVARLAGLRRRLEVEHVTTPLDWAGARHGARHAVRRRAHLRPDRPVPAAQPVGRQRRVRRQRDAPRRRGADGAAVRSPGRGAHPDPIATDAATSRPPTASPRPTAHDRATRSRSDPRTQLLRRRRQSRRESPAVVSAVTHAPIVFVAQREACTKRI
jgi:hypothetical protein